MITHQEALSPEFAIRAALDLSEMFVDSAVNIEAGFEQLWKIGLLLDEVVTQAADVLPMDLAVLGPEFGDGGAVQTAINVIVAYARALNGMRGQLERRLHIAQAAGRRSEDLGNYATTSFSASRRQ